MSKIQCLRFRFEDSVFGVCLDLKVWGGGIDKKIEPIFQAKVVV